MRRFKQEMRAGFRFERGRFGRTKDSNEERWLAESQQGGTPVPSHGPTPDYQTALRGRTWASSLHKGDPSSSSCTTFKWARQKGSRTVVLEGDASADPGLEGADGLGEESEHQPGSSGTQPSAQVNGVCGESCDETSAPTNSDASGTSPQARCQTDDEAETCQRARVYFRKRKFSCARTDMPWPLLSSASRTAAPACPAPPARPTETVSSLKSTNKPDTSDGCSEEAFSAPDGPPSGSRPWLNRQDENESTDGFLTGGNDEPQGNSSSHSPDSTKTGFAPDSWQGEEARPRPPSNGPGVHGGQASADFSSPLPHSGHQSDCCRTSPPPSAVVVSDRERTRSFYSTSPPPSFQPRGGVGVTLAGASSPNSQGLELQFFVSEDAQVIFCSPSFAPADSCDSFHSSGYSLLLRQDMRHSDEDPLSRSPKPPPHYDGSPTDEGKNTVLALVCRTCGESDDPLPPMLSPVASPCRRPWRRLLSWSSGSSEREEEDAPHPVHGNSGNSSVDLQDGFEGPGGGLKPAPSPEPPFPPSAQNGIEPSSPSSCADVSSDAWDEVTAYKRDILLVDVTPEDAELFENLPQESLLKLGPLRFSEEPKRKPLRTARKQQPNAGGASGEREQR